ncbi:uncharacterized protein LOC121791808 [Salvia splendens]|uniref:uncharacterized protein LOC121791808 n=1 Tax=Salvia splendens TaxID=180675 RepID=UPI001C25A4B3|nr:uncharacterized protein LOC121791808 [Salvia splendens]
MAPEGDLGNFMSINKYHALMEKEAYETDHPEEDEVIGMEIVVQPIPNTGEDVTSCLGESSRHKNDRKMDNVRGIVKTSSRNVIKRLIVVHNISFMAIMEPFTAPNPELYSKFFGLNFKGANTSGKIWNFTREGVNFDVMDDSEQALHGILRLEAGSQPVAVTVIYAKCTRAERYPLWDKLRDLADNLGSRPWIIGGEFNTILNPRDRSGSESNSQAEMLDFAEAIEDCRLVDVCFDGAPFTWVKNNLFEKLDRVFINEQWTSVFEATRITNLPRVASDHGPILVRCKTEVTGEQGRNFQFQNMWLRHEGFRGVVESSWSQPTEAGGLLNLQIKLVRLKKVLKEWNRATFGNLQSNLKEAEATIVEAQQAFEADASPTNRCRASDLESLATSPNEEEIKRAVWSISADSTPGTDGFTASFYHSCWDIIGRDVGDAVIQFFNGAFLPRTITATMIVLLPKKDNPASWSDYRPISLCNVSNKIITNVLASRLAPVLPKVISPNQSGFIKGRLLNDNVLLAQEMFHELYRRRPAPNVAIKIDMAKAYDRVQSPFLIQVMRRMGFPETFLSLIGRCIGIVAEYLSRALDELILGKMEMTFKSKCACSDVSHLAYADDIVIFTQAAKESIQRVRACLDEYSAVSGQKINLSKSNFYITETNGDCAGTVKRRVDLLEAPVEGKRRTHWIAWEQICLPTTEGGLGIRKFEDVLKAFNVKLWWRVREQNSLWASHMYSKYCASKSPLARLNSGRSSPTWRRLAAAWPLVQLNIRWIIGDGRALFWDDIWLRDRPIRDLCLDTRGDPTTRVAEFWMNGKWDGAKVGTTCNQTGMPPHVAEAIMSTPILLDSPDVPRWTLSRGGNFSLSSAWDSNRARRPRIPALGDIWHGGISTTISVFMWRLISNRIPVDAKLQWRNISLASKCQCCPRQPGLESIHHLFINGQGASMVWRLFDEWFDGASHPLRPSDSIPSRLEAWAKRINRSTKDHMARTLPCIILWYLWAERNNSRHNGVCFRAYNVVWQVRLYVQKLVESGRARAKHFKDVRFEGLTLPVHMYIRNSMANGCLKPKHWRGVKLGINIPQQAEAIRALPLAMAIKWEPPDPPWIKVNTDGSFNEAINKAGGGGVIRDFSGKMLVAFCIPFEAQSALEAELLAMIHGLNIAKEFGLPIWIESDAEQAIKLINGAGWGPALAREAMAHLILLKRQLKFRATFIHREGNKAADFLARMGLGRDRGQQMQQDSVPRELADLVRMDQMGLSHVRTLGRDGD